MEGTRQYRHPILQLSCRIILGPSYTTHQETLVTSTLLEAEAKHHAAQEGNSSSFWSIIESSDVYPGRRPADPVIIGLCLYLPVSLASLLRVFSYSLYTGFPLRSSNHPYISTSSWSLGFISFFHCLSSHSSPALPPLPRPPFLLTFGLSFIIYFQFLDNLFFTLVSVSLSSYCLRWKISSLTLGLPYSKWKQTAVTIPSWPVLLLV